MRILMVLEKFFPPDIRVEKEARSLLQAGHEVYVLSLSNCNAAATENVDGVRVIRAVAQRGFVSRFWHFWWDPLFLVNDYWRKQLRLAIREHRIEALHVHDLPLLGTGLAVGREFSIPVIADLHENYPEAHRLWSERLGLMRRVAYRTAPWKWAEKRCLPLADRVITVVEGHREHYIKDCGCLPQKVIVVSNYEDLNYFLAIPVKEHIASKYQGSFAITYVGAMNAARGLNTAVQAMPGIMKAIPNARLILVGTGSAEAELRDLVHHLGLDEIVEFTGWQPFRLVASYIAASDVCLHTYVSTNSPQSLTSSPNKVFQYMAMGKPVVVASSQKWVCDLITSASAGVVYSAGDPHSLARTVIALHKDPLLAGRMGQNGKEKVSEYDWKKEGEKLCDLYLELGARSTG